MRSHFSKVLMDEIESALKEKAQTILFQNRRGFSLRLECDQCNWVPECRQCDVSLIYHKKQNMLRCHYCGYGIAVPHECPSCHSTALRMHGFGTEKVEEELGILLPESRIARLDLDTTRSKTSFQLILEAFGRGDVDILAGTQMVTKGLDFENVRVVGILNADNMLSYPDFRAYERSYQLMAQVSGRAGRKHTRGKVLIQTFQPYHPLLKHVILNKFDEMAEEQLLLRQQYHYPPYYRLILIKLKHRDEHLLARGASDMAAMLREVFANNVLGPEYPMVSRIKNLYIKQIMIKFGRQHSASRVKQHILEISSKLSRKADFKTIMIQFDVDPY
jgi:primosomal protein N' (replication factor Y)